jgi:hypothetical protein
LEWEGERKGEEGVGKEEMRRRGLGVDKKSVRGKDKMMQELLCGAHLLSPLSGCRNHAVS